MWYYVFRHVVPDGSKGKQSWLSSHTGHLVGVLDPKDRVTVIFQNTHILNYTSSDTKSHTRTSDPSAILLREPHSLQYENQSVCLTILIAVSVYLWCCRGSVVLKSEGLWNILQLQSKMERGALPGAAKRGLFKALILVGAAVDDVQSRGEYWIQVHLYNGAVTLSHVSLYS